MKVIRYISFLCVVLLTGCNDGFMELYPETSISPEAFFKTVKDLELYTNTYYTSLTPARPGVDFVSDNCLSYADSHNNNSLIRGNITSATIGGWGKGEWGTLRKYNLFLEHAGNMAGGDAAMTNHYIGLTRLLRADWYYALVKAYSDVPWYSTALTDADEELLYKGRDPRTLVVDSVVADLEFAVRNMSESMGNRTVLSRWYAAALMARICLHEGTFRKYHDELNLRNTADAYLRKAVEVAETVMNSGLFAIDGTNGSENAYRRLFTSTTLSSSPEIILFKDYDRNTNILHEAGYVSFNWVTNFSRNLMESYQYLTPEGKAVPFTSIPGYEKKKFVEVFENRDPRFRQTFMYPGFILPGQSSPFRPNMNFGGYAVIKYLSEDPTQYAWQSQHTDVPLFRYAELLLIYAEAKAELGEITQADLDRSINLIRGRVDLPPTILSDMVEDPVLKAQFPGVTDYIILEVRRERRIELVNENFRWDDLMRWKAGHLIEQIQQGIYIDAFGVFDITGDGIPEIGIFENEASNTVPQGERGNYSFYYLKDAAGNPGTFSLSGGDSGYIVINGEIDNRSFKQPQYYYWPVPQTQILLNPNLKQTVFWE